MSLIGLARQIPNALSWMRILCALGLFLFVPFSLWFMVLYIFAGVSDMIDGLIARKLNAGSVFGANLDSASDLVFACIGLYILLPVVDFPAWAAPVAIGLVSTRFISMAIAGVRFKQFVMLHTIGNKVFVGIAWLIFLIYPLVSDITVFLIIGCIIGFITCLEDLMINATSKEPAYNNKGFLFKKVENDQKVDP